MLSYEKFCGGRHHQKMENFYIFVRKVTSKSIDQIIGNHITFNWSLPRLFPEIRTWVRCYIPKYLLKVKKETLEQGVKYVQS